MAERAPRLTGDEVSQALRRAGWYDDRKRGSHLVMRHPDRPGIVVVPIHAGEIIPHGTFRSILEQAGLTMQEFRELL